MAKLLFYRKYQPQNLKEMKNIFKILGALALTITVVSCGSSNVYGDNGRVYRAPDGRVYRQGEIYRAPNGDVYRNGVLTQITQLKFFEISLWGNPKFRRTIFCVFW